MAWSRKLSPWNFHICSLHGIAIARDRREEQLIGTYGKTATWEKWKTTWLVMQKRMAFARETSSDSSLIQGRKSTLLHARYSRIAGDEERERERKRRTYVTLRDWNNDGEQWIDDARDEKERARKDIAAQKENRTRTGDRSGRCTVRYDPVFPALCLEVSW